MINIRSAQPGDVSAFIELARHFPTPTPVADNILADIFQRKLRDTNAYLLVAELRLRLVGYVSGYKHAAFYAGGETSWVDEILVEEAERRRDIGRLLMSAFEERGKADGCKLVSLATASAGPFYLKLGYETKAGYFKKYLSPNSSHSTD